MTPDEQFAIFYSEYPRRMARKDALKAWSKLRPSEALFETIIEALRRQKDIAWAGKSSEYLPYPATWIRGERWTDEVQEPHRCVANCALFGCDSEVQRRVR